jgi:hypothetical protein
MRNEKMEQETHGITTKDNDNQDKIQTEDKRLLSPKSGILNQAIRRPPARS